MPGWNVGLLQGRRSENGVSCYIIMGMIDITGKKTIVREARASGRIILSPETIQTVRDDKIKKGDPRAVAEIAAMNAAKETSRLIPHCHQIPLNTVELDFSLGKEFIEVSCFVKAEAMTGVEMEALVGVSIALAVIWDMVKYLEKDTGGQYPSTRISDIRVLEKVKRPVPQSDVA
jgi:cyclic pyranopterin phosphate synthase